MDGSQVTPSPSAPTKYVPLVPGVIVDTTGLGTLIDPFGNVNSGPFVYGQFLYCVTLSLSNTIQVSKSPDGISWTILDASHEPAFGNAVYYVVGSLIYVGVWNTASLGVQFLTFNLSTAKWGTSVIITSPPTVNPRGLVVRKDGSYVLLDRATSTLITSGFTAYVYAGGSWGSAIDFGAGLLSEPHWDTTVNPVMGYGICTDGTNTFIFACAQSSTATGWSNYNIFFARLNGSNVVDEFMLYPGNLGATTGDFLVGANLGQPCVFGTSPNQTIVFPIVRTGTVSSPSYPSFWISFNSGSTWTELAAPGIDPTQYATYSSGFTMTDYAPMVTTDGLGNLYFVYALEDAAGFNTIIRISQVGITGTNPNLWTFSPSNAQLLSNYPPQYNSFYSPFLLYVGGQPGLFLSANIEDTSFDEPAIFLGGAFNSGTATLGPGLPYQPLPFCVEKPMERRFNLIF